MNELRISATAEKIPFVSASLSAGIDAWLWDFSAELSDESALKKLIPARNLGANYVPVTFTLGAQSWALIIEDADSNDTGFSYSVRGRSKSVVLAEPYANKITKTWTNSTAKTIAQELCDNAGITLNWAVLDWVIADYSVDKRYPIDIIAELAADLGAKVQSLPDGTLAVVYYPGVSPDALPVANSDYQFATDVNIFERAHTFVNTLNHNRIVITTDSSSQQPSVSIEEKEDGDDKLLKVFIQPFHTADEINIYHRSSGGVSMFYEGVYDEQIVDDVIVQDGTGKLSKPFHELIGSEWQQDVSGTLSFAADGTVTCSGSEIGLVTVTYKTQFLQYRFNRLSDAVKKTLVVIDELEAMTSGNSITVIMGAGDREAEPVIVKTLSSTAALLERAKSELWPQVYDASEYDLSCAYAGVPVLPGKVAEVSVKRDADLFNGWVKSVGINVGNEITQAIKVVRPLND